MARQNSNKAVLETMEKAVRSLFNEKDCYYEVYPCGETIAVEITWGDWKHDHGFVDYLLRTIFGFKKVDEEITEEDGSDTYSSIHYFTPSI